MIRSVSFPALGTTATLAVTDGRALDPGRTLLAAELRAVDRACSRFRDDSELARVNALPGEPVLVSDLLAEAVDVALDVAAWTDGAVSPLLGRPLRLAGYDRTFRLVRERERWSFTPDDPRPQAWRGLQVDLGRRLVAVPPGTELDLGATAKALAADRAARDVFAATGAGALVSLGGDVAVAGPPPAGGWIVGIADDHSAPHDAAVAVTVGGIATSSTLVRRWPTKGGEAHHIIDPRTARPAVSAWRTVSVAAPSCVLANAAATAAVVKSDAALEWLSRRRLPARLVGRDGRTVVVGGWPADEAAA